MLAGAFGGLLASAIGNMDGLRGYRGWRWVFIIGEWSDPNFFGHLLSDEVSLYCDTLEGLMTCVISALLFFFIADFPEEVKWLTPAEKDFVRTRLQEDVGYAQEHEKITVKSALRVLADCK